MFERECPKCKRIIRHTNKANRNHANKKGKICRLCVNQSNSINNAGKNNPMYGKSLYSVWIKKYGTKEADKRLIEYGYNRKGKKLNLSLEALEKRCHRGTKNGMFGTNLEELMLKKYGAKEGTQRIISRRKKMSSNSLGENNPMYGKPSPTGSGNGWSGWYKENYFRSLMELSYLVYLYDNKINFESGENKKHSIKYYDTYRQQEANYFPDYYLIDTQEIIEIKPKKLLMAQKNIDKYKAAKKKFKKKFVVITENNLIKLTDEKIKELHDNKELKFIDRYEQKFIERYNK